MGIEGGTPELLRGATVPGAGPVDVQLEDGKVREVLPAGTAPLPSDPGAVLELDGYLLVGAMAEPHAHLDKAGSWTASTRPWGICAPPSPAGALTRTP